MNSFCFCSFVSFWFISFWFPSIWFRFGRFRFVSISFYTSHIGLTKTHQRAYKTTSPACITVCHYKYFMYYIKNNLKVDFFFFADNFAIIRKYFKKGLYTANIRKWCLFSNSQCDVAGMEVVLKPWILIFLP